jgi:PTH2 family peptidyl-tRNA hydrolase
MDELRMCAVVRGDLAIPPGKLAAQVGHAFVGAWVSAAPLGGEWSITKIVLRAESEEALLRVMDVAARRGVPHALVRDQGRTVFATPTVTCLGLGPMGRTDYNAVTRGLSLY